MDAVMASKYEQENSETSLPPRPQELYPLARSCKGFWHCLRPLLYHFDVILPTTVFKHVSDPDDWVLYAHASKGTALSWGIENNQMNTINLAVETARAAGELGIYGAITHRRQSTAAAPFYEEPAGAVVFVDALFQAVLHGNTAVVELLTEDADASTLNRTLNSRNIPTSSSLSHLARRHHPGSMAFMKVTALHVAIRNGCAEIVEVLLTRYSQLDQSTLDWYEPTGLQMAAYIGDVDMAALILDGSSPDCPWAARAQSQLVDPRAYEITSPGRENPLPPMITASLGMSDTVRRKNGDEIFSFLAARGGQHLLTKPYLHRMFRTHSHTPLDFALINAAPTDEPLSSHEQARIIGLIKSGAFATRDTIAPSATIPHFWAPTVHHLWEWYEGLRSMPDDRAPQIKFMEECWDAAVEQRQGEIDTEFVDGWADGVGQCLPDLDPTSFPPTSCSSYEHHMSVVRSELEAHASLISLFESKAPGFAKHSTIRYWLDTRLFQRSSRRGINHTNLKGDWSHLL